ncbi:MAG: hypothetical protein WC716_13195 [Chitinophagaceae bacterium]|jgi:hypothetical protein
MKKILIIIPENPEQTFLIKFFNQNLSMRFFRTISAFLIFIFLPKLVFADQLDGTSGMGELFFGLGVVL